MYPNEACALVTKIIGYPHENDKIETEIYVFYNS